MTPEAPPAVPTPVERRRLEVGGVVQGVGFRPFVYWLARSQGLTGFVLNNGGGVVIEAEGPAGTLDAFARALAAEAPSLARVDEVSAARIAAVGDAEFVIAASVVTAGGAAIPADIATCDDCLRELFDPADRRHRYPFINCTQCGPRFTIVRDVPYDRPNTTMAGFAMCADCRREYTDPADRRFHAEPIACAVCGPRLTTPLAEAVALLRGGAVLAVKGLGGYHLACDATGEGAVALLRARKHRDDKPFAVMTNAPESLADLADDEAALLRSRERPIVLVRRRTGSPVAEAVAPGSPWLGLMLPYTPLHHLLLADFGGPLVMTSGNRSDEPIAFADDDARERLCGIADAFLAHDRPIHRRCEDSVVRAAFPLRRSRGHAPDALPLPVAAPEPVVAVGAAMKSTFCVARARSRVPVGAPRRPRYRAGVQRLHGRSRPVPRDARRRPAGDRPRPAPRLPVDPLGAGPRRRAGRRPAPPRPRRRLHGRARRHRPGAGAGVRRHGVRHRRHHLGRRAAALRSGDVRARRPPRSECRCPAARRRSASRGASPPPIWPRPAGPCRSTAGGWCGRASA